MDKRKKLFIAVICLMVTVMGTCIIGLMVRKSSSFVPPFTVLGDVEEVLTVRELKKAGALEKITFDGNCYKTAKLTELISKAKPLGKIKKVFFVASDGFTSAIEGDSLDQSYISFSPENGWISLNLHHPLSSNVKMIQEIIVLCESGSGKNCFTLVRGQDLLNTTVGQLYTGTTISYPYFEGQATVEHGGMTYKSGIFTRRRVFRLGDLTSLDRKAKVMLWGEKGEYQLADQNGYYELCGNYINYIQPETREKLEMVRLAIVNPPPENIMDTYYDALHYLENGENILVVILNGLSYRDYKDALKNGYAPFLAKNAPGNETRAMGVFPLKANSWQASMLTGLPPLENGILKGSDKDLTGDTLFTKVEEIGKKALILDAGNPLHLGARIPVRDNNANGSADDEIYEGLLKNIDAGYAFIMVKFDSTGASKIPLREPSSQKENALARIDSYLKEIAGRWQGKIIVTAVPDDNSFFVPYLFFSGKNQSDN